MLTAQTDTAADFASIAAERTEFAAMRRRSCDSYCDMAQDAEDKGEINLMRIMDRMATMDQIEAIWAERSAATARLLAALAA